MLLIALLWGPALMAQKVFLKGVSDAHLVDQAVAPDGSIYCILGLADRRTSITLDGHRYDFGRPTETFLARMSASGQWLWAKGFGGDFQEAALRCVAAGDNFIVVGGWYRRGADRTMSWDGIGISENGLSVNPDVNHRQGLLLKLTASRDPALGGRLITPHEFRNVELDNPAPLTLAINYDRSESESQVTSVAIGADDSIKVAATYTPKNSPPAEDQNFPTTSTCLIASVVDANGIPVRMVLYPNQEFLTDETYRFSHRRIPFVASFDDDLTFQWARQILTTPFEGFESAAQAAAAGASHHGEFTRIRVDPQGNTYFAGRLVGGRIAASNRLPGGDEPGRFLLVSGISRTPVSDEDPTFGRFVYQRVGELLPPADFANYSLFNSYVIGRFDPDGQLTGLNFDTDTGTISTESFISDFVLTDNGGYAVGASRGGSLHADPHAQSLRLLIPSGVSLPAQTNPDHQNAFVLRFSTFLGDRLPINNWAVFKNDDWADRVWTKGLGIDVDAEERVFAAIGNRTGVTTVLSNTSSQSNDDGSGAVAELNLRDPSGSEGDGGLVALIRFNKDLTYSGEKFVAENQFPLSQTPLLDRRDGDLGEVGTARLKLTEARVEVSPAGFLYWSGFIDGGVLRLGKGDSGSGVISDGRNVFHLSGLDLNRGAPFGGIPFLEQVVLRINAGLPAFRDAHDGVHPDVQDLILPVPNTSHVRIRGTQATISVPHRLFSDVERNPATGLPIPGGPGPLLYQVLADADGKPVPNETYLDDRQWPNYPRTRHTFSGFRLEDRVESSGQPVFALVLDTDTTVDLDYLVEHAIDTVAIVTQETATEQILADAEQRLLGNPSYSTASGANENLDLGLAGYPSLPRNQWRWGRTWVLEGDTVQIDVGINGASSLPLGERFVSPGYTVRGSGSQSVTLDNLQVFSPEPVTMTGPLEYEFRWRKQVQVRLGPLSEAEARDSVFFVRDGESTLAQRAVVLPYRDAGETDGPSFWFDYGIRLLFGVGDRPVKDDRSPTGLQLNGWLTAGGHFPTSQGQLSQLTSEPAGISLGSYVITTFPQAQNLVAPMPGAIPKVTPITVDPPLFVIEWMSPPSHLFPVNKLTRPTFVTWNYGGFLFREFLAIGQAVEGARINGTGLDSVGNAYQLNRPGLIANREPLISMVDAPAGSSAANSLVWDPARRRLLPLRPGRYLAQFATVDPDPADGRTPRALLLEVTAGFPGDPLVKVISTAPGPIEAEFTFPGLGNAWPGPYKLSHYRHIAGAPPVNLDGTIADGFAFLDLPYFEGVAGAAPGTVNPAPVGTSGSALVNEAGFTSSLPGKSVLLFSRSHFVENPDGSLDPNALVDPASFPATGNRDREPLFVRVVETRRADDATVGWAGNGSLIQQGPAQVIGSPVGSALDTAGLGTGWILNDSPRLLIHRGIYNRDEVSGPVIPVNRRLPGGARPPVSEELVVVWYENPGQTSVHQEPPINWPYQPVRYDSEDFHLPFQTEALYTSASDPATRVLPLEANILYSSSRLGSEGLRRNHGGDWERQTVPAVDPETGAVEQLALFDPRFTEHAVYHQPDRALPGYNPNEEHALIAPSILAHAVGDTGLPVPGEIAPRAGADDAFAVFALRDDLNRGLAKIARSRGVPNLDPAAEAFDEPDREAYTSDPFVLVQYFDTVMAEHRMALYFVGHESDIYRFQYEVTATKPIRAPYPVDTLVSFGTNDSDQSDNEDPDGAIDGTYFIHGDSTDIGNEQAVWWLDTVGTAYAISGPVQRRDASGNLLFEDASKLIPTLTSPHLFAGFFYNLRADLWHPDPDTSAGDPVAWLPGWVNGNGPRIPPSVTAPRGVPTPIRFDTLWPAVIPILKAGETLAFPGGEYKADHPTRTTANGEIVETPGLPGVIGWAAGRILFDSANPAMRLAMTSHFSARLINPLRELRVGLRRADVFAETSTFQPASDRVTARDGIWRFSRLSASLQKRVSYDPLLQSLRLNGLISGRNIGDPVLTAAPDPVHVLEPNVLTETEAAELVDPDRTFDSSAWRTAVTTLYNKSRDPQVRIDDATGLEDEGLEPDRPIGAPGGPPSFLAGLEQRRPPNPDTGFSGSIYFDADGLTHAAAFGPGLAVVPNGDFLDPDPDGDPATDDALREGYVTLAENVHPDVADLSPVTLFVVKIDRGVRYRGAIKTVESQNVFDEQVLVKHTADFGGNLEDVTYEWWFTPAAPGDVGSPDAPTSRSNWRRLPGATRNEVLLKGDPTLLLGDMLFFARYRHRNEADFGTTPDGPWEWAGAGNSPQLQANGSRKYLPQLVMGWVKRVLDRVNPYEARFSDFGGHESPATYASLIQAAGSPPRGPVALNPDKNVVENVGLIELYQTILDRAAGLSIGLDQPAGSFSIWQALMLAATRVNQLYMVLGNEAYSDAQDPTTGLSDLNLSPAVFAFQNLESSLLHEELAMLRGTDYGKGWPVENRLFWNFVKGEGEPAYVSNYGINDVNGDGFINESDAKIQYPQGHGDAWGHYLSAGKAHYALLRHPAFNWRTFAELYNLLDIVIETDFLDEITFARTAAAKARAGLDIVRNTYRIRYEQDPDGQWQGYEDSDAARAWGVGEWSTRAYQGAYFDWAVANALMPFRAGESGEAGADDSSSQLNRIERVSVAELVEMGTVCSQIQQTLDEANSGLNPLGLTRDSVPFDLSTSENVGKAGRTHFQQIFDRSLAASQNAITALDHANALENRLRSVAQDTEDARRLAQDQDLSYRGRLIEIFGTPYDGLIGPGGLYPPGYSGPDLLLYQYIDYNSVDDHFLPGEARAFKDLFTTEFAGAYTERLTDAQRAIFANYGIGSPGYALKDLIESFTRLDVKPPDGDGDGVPDYATFYDRFANGTNFTIRSARPLDDPSLTPALDNVEGRGELISFRIPISATAMHGFRADPNWGRRRAPGRIQQKLQELVDAQIDLRKALDDYEGFLRNLQATIHHHQAGFQVAAINLQQETAIRTLEQILAAARLVKERVQQGIESASRTADGIADSLREAVPDVVGVAANDVLASLESAIVLQAAISEQTFNALDFGVETAFSVSEYAFGLEKDLFELTAMARSFRGEQRAFVLGLIEELSNESTIRFAMASSLNAIVEREGELASLISEGFRLVAEREVSNKRLAADTQQRRYSDALLRVNRNDALQRYQGALDLALRYAYLAAKAYDYETNLDPSHPASPAPLFNQLVRTRTLGLWADGQPRIGQGGLAEMLARLKENFDVLGGQLGFNNPQREVGRLSLRHEWARIKPDVTSDDRWRKLLQGHRVADLRAEPDFQRFCRPFAPPSAGPQPGLLIPLGTEITEGRNFFGRAAGGLDHVYDTTHFSTKIRSVGVWFTGYDGGQLTLTPRIYLVPAGTDIMLVPDSTTLKRREWNVIDQKIPVPFPFSAQDLRNPDWIVSGDSLNGSFADIQKYSRFRAFPDFLESEPFFDETELTRDTRLVGRSVWNTRWLLIIPGSTLHSDPNLGLDRFIGSDQQPGVADIKLLFETYAHSGR